MGNSKRMLPCLRGSERYGIRDDEVMGILFRISGRVLAHSASHLPYAKKPAAEKATLLPSLFAASIPFRYKNTEGA